MLLVETSSTCNRLATSNAPTATMLRRLAKPVIALPAFAIGRKTIRDGIGSADSCWGFACGCDWATPERAPWHAAVAPCCLFCPADTPLCKHAEVPIAQVLCTVWWSDERQLVWWHINLGTHLFSHKRFFPHVYLWHHTDLVSHKIINPPRLR